MNHQKIKEVFPESNLYLSFEPIHKGWSSDYKFKICNSLNQFFLLRISNINDYERKKYEYEILNHPKLENCNIIKPIQIGITLDNQYCYSLSKWIDGYDTEEIIQQLPIDKQYKLGYEAGQILRQIHSVEINTDIQWKELYQNKIDRKIKNSLDCPLQLDKLNIYLDYIKYTRDLIDNRPMCFQHGDFHIGNTLIDTNNKLVLIDFNRHDIGDPWEEFNRIPLSVKVSEAFATGSIDGYFNNQVPDSFFQILALYISVNQISALPWAMQFTETEINFMKSLSEEILKDYRDFNTVIPNWYKPINKMI